ncbi:MAG: tRNA-(ms[2]io[6]A)-hydroxylase [Planctomycetaceae bacterium]|nr:tRNA-(ms[2]io[6]A)-hydroxylase [Planctomycetaceae bacterium]
MLNLKSSTAPWWLETVETHLEEVLVDHAHCEKKAAGTALNLIFHYVDKLPLIRELTPIVNEELAHFQLVLDLLEERGMTFRRLVPSSYGRKLNDLVRKNEPQRAIDRLLVAALIEARSCERFQLLRDRLKDQKLAHFYGSLYASEARHHATYVNLARLFDRDGTEVDRRLDELASAEAAIIDEGDDLARVHS